MKPKIIDVTYGPDVKANVTEPPRLYVATPCYGCTMTHAFLCSVLQLHDVCAQRGVHLYTDFIGNESLVQRARNILAARFLNSNATHLLFIDADIAFPPSNVFRLLEFNKDIVTGVYPKKAYNWEGIEQKLRGENKVNEPVHMMGLDYNINLEGSDTVLDNGFAKVLDSATGFMMIKREALVRMCAKFADTLSCVNDLPGNREDPRYIQEYVAVFDCMIDPKTKRYLSEDYAFVRRAQEMGIDIWADLASPLCHIGSHNYDGDLSQRFVMAYAS